MALKQWGIQRRVILFLFLAVFLSSLIVALVVAWAANRELMNTARQDIALLHTHLRDRFRAFDLLLAEQEDALNRQLQEILPQAAARIASREEPPSGVPVALLNDLCRRYGFDHLYIIDRDGVVVNTNFAPDRGLDLARVGPDMRRMLERLYGRGEVFSDRFNVSVKTGVLRKYAYYSPPGSDYIVEVSLDLRGYIRRTGSRRLEHFLFNELLQPPTSENSRISDLGIYIANDIGSWSLTRSGDRLPEEVRRAFARRGVKHLRLEQGDRLTVYERYPRLDSGSGETDSLVTRVTYDIGPTRALLHRTLWLAAGLAAALAVLAFFLAVPFFQRWLVRPVTNIAAGLDEMGRGEFRPQAVTGVPELDVITRGINAMQAEIEQRQQALIRARDTLEERVRERTAELEKLNEELTRLARTDALTGVSSRRVFFERGQVEVARVRRQHTPLSTAVLDVDHFKSINDTFGHETGDAVLRSVGGVLNEELRMTDIAARLGGEEFGILLVGSDEAASLEVLERIRRRIADTIHAAYGEDLSVTVSIGLAECGNDDDIVNVLRRADRALYRAKRGGRNRVMGVSG